VNDVVPDVQIHDLVVFETPQVKLRDLVVFQTPDIFLNDLILYSPDAEPEKNQLREWVESLIGTVVFVIALPR